MKAWVVDEYSTESRFRETERDRPVAGPGEIVIQVKASSLNPIDFKIRTTDIGINPDLPAILHMDVSGVVSEVGDGVTDFKEGDEVYGCPGGLKGEAGQLDGALADFMLADASTLAHKPKSLDFGGAAALPLVSITAWNGLFDKIGLQAGDQVLIHGGTGGVGHIALQLAASHGCRVATTVSTEAKAEIARELGAKDTILYPEESVADYVNRLTDGRGFTAIYDTVGGDNLDKSFEAAADGGQIACTIGRNKHDLSPMHSKALSLHLVFMAIPLLTDEGRSHHGEILRQLAVMVDAGKIKPLLHEKRFSFSEVDAAHALYASGNFSGKIVLER